MIAARDAELLRRFEPVIRYTHGEYFFPMAAEPYVAACDLWAGPPDGGHRLLAAPGELSLDSLAEWQSRMPGQPLFLRFVQEPMSGLELARNERARRPAFSAPSRLARVGIAARLIDAGFDLSLLVRGTVPGGTVAAAEAKYARIREVAPDTGHSYYGRVLRVAGWTVCHYLFFYAMNDWRSSFAGANDHEADWEQCFVFLDEHGDGGVEPVWFARAAHDEVGADLRRRWDDTLLLREGDHPIVFAGAGSHAAYVEAGEYLQAVPLHLPAWLEGLMGAAQAFWAGTLRQGTLTAAGGGRLAAVPFVDYARGDGLSVGPGQQANWTLIPISDDDPWVGGFAGLFGLDTQDRLAGERAPAGPKFDRDGRPRQSWIDPVGFAGLQAVPPPSLAPTVLEQASAALRADLDDTRRRLADAEMRAQQLGTRLDASKVAGRPEASLTDDETALEASVADLTTLRQRVDELQVAITDAAGERERLARGDRGDPRAHLRFVAHPQDPALIRRSRFLDVWSAVGIAAALVLLGALLFLAVQWWWVGLLVVIAGYVVIESLVRRRFLLLLLNITILLAVVGALILIGAHLLEGLAIVLLLIGVLILRDNVRELRRSVGRG